MEYCGRSGIGHHCLTALCLFQVTPCAHIM